MTVSGAWKAVCVRLSTKVLMGSRSGRTDGPPGTLSSSIVLDSDETTVQRQVVTYRVLQENNNTTEGDLQYYIGLLTMQLI